MTKIQAGDVWESRDGSRIEIVSIDPFPYVSDFPVNSLEGFCFTIDGYYWREDNPDGKDLIKLISRKGDVKSAEQSGKTPHKHAELIKAWADGAEIEFYSNNDKVWKKRETPAWLDGTKYRIKPEEPVSRWLNVYDPMLDHMPTPVWCNSLEKANNNAVSGRIAVIEDKQDSTPWILHQI